MKRIKPFVPMHIYTLESIYKSLVPPYFDYCSPPPPPPFGTCTCGKLLRDKLQRFQSRAARVLTDANYDTRSADILNNMLSWDTHAIENRRFNVFLRFKHAPHGNQPRVDGLACSTSFLIFK